MMLQFPDDTGVMPFGEYHDDNTGCRSPFCVDEMVPSLAAVMLHIATKPNRAVTFFHEYSLYMHKKATCTKVIIKLIITAM